MVANIRLKVAKHADLYAEKNLLRDPTVKYAPRSFLVYVWNTITIIVIF